MKKILTHCSQKLLNVFFPKFCLFCQKEGNPLCDDCKATFEILEQNFCLCPKPKVLLRTGKCKDCQSKELAGLYFSLSYEEPRVKLLIQSFKYKPFLRELAKPLASFIVAHFLLKEQKPSFPHFVFIPIPLAKKRLRWRGFNQAEEIAKELTTHFQLPLISDCLLKIKKTPPQIELSDKEREENVKNVFLVKDEEKIKGKKIFLVDDVYTTGSTMEEAARVLKKAGSKEVWGMAVARSGKV